MRTLNKSKIEWCGSTWNPVTGCLHGCDYCYAKKIANRFSLCSCVPDGKPHELNEPKRRDNSPGGDFDTPKYILDPYPYKFDPTFHRYRLDEPSQKTKSQNIFVCSMADLFGDWVPDEWISEVMNKCCYADQHRYLFLTKNPKRYYQLGNMLCKEKHCWYGITIENQETYLKRARETKAIPGLNLFLSIEPLQGNIELYPFTLKVVKWVIVGAETGPGAKPPQPEWVQSIINQCRDAGIPLFLKNNLNWPMKIQEYPWEKEKAK